MIFGKRPPRAVRRHMATETASETLNPGAGNTGSQVIRTPPIKPFARTAAPAPPVSKPPVSKPPVSKSPVSKPAASPRPAAVVARPASRGALPDRRQIPGQPPGQVPGHTLVVGRDIRLTGEISACQRLIVEGSVEAELTDTHTLEIADTGHFRGSAAVGNCTISGSFDGDLTVSGLLAVRAGGRIGGAIRYTEIEVERGGRITGRADVQGPQEVPDTPDTKDSAEPQRAGSGSGLRPA